VPGRFKVIRHIARSCRAGPATRWLRRRHRTTRLRAGRAGAGLLAHIVVSKYDDHLPLYRQAEIFARAGVSLETSGPCPAGVGATAAALQPLVRPPIATDVPRPATRCMSTTHRCRSWRRYRKTKTGRLWTYVRDERPFARLAAGRRPCSSTRPTARASVRRRI